MIPDGILQILLVIVSLIGGGAFWYFISQKQYHYALWSGLAGCIILLLVIAFYIRNYIIAGEIKAKTPVYFGEIVPSNEPSSPLPANYPKDTITLMLGDNLRVLAAKSENYIFSIRGQKVISLSIKDSLMYITASIVDSKNEYIVRIIDNEFQASQERAFNPKQPDKHSLIVRDSHGVEVLNIRFLNPKAMRIVGRFSVQGYKEPLLVLPKQGIRFPGGGDGGISNLTIDLTDSPKGLGVLDID